MRLLLDTHVWLWSLLAPERLSRRVTKALGDRETELWLSPISVWEVFRLAERKRVVFEQGVDAWVAGALAAAPIRDASFTAAMAFATRDVDLPHKDPADLFLVATARVLGLTLVTSDETLISSAQVSILSNR